MESSASLEHTPGKLPIDLEPILDSASSSTTCRPVEGTLMTSKVSEPTPSLENIMTEKGALLWKLSDIRGFVVGGFKVDGVISAMGANGLVVSCTDAGNNPYAMKIERKLKSMDIDNIALREITDSCLNKGEDDLYIPRLKTSFHEQGKEISVMELLGPDLYTLHICNVFSHKTTMQIGLSLITAYEQIHQSGWLHLTTKPINFCIGGTPETRHKVYAIDFGRAQKYIVKGCYGREVHRSRHTYCAASPLHEAFSSVWGDDGCVPSRRGEMMSLALMLMYLEGNMFPWTNEGLTKLEWVCKLQFRERTLWESLIVYAWNMEFHEQPCYEEWRQTIRDWAAEKEIKLDGQFDWDDRIKDENGRIVLRSA